MNNLEQQLHDSEQTLNRASGYVDEAELDLDTKRRALAKARDLKDAAEIAHILDGGSKVSPLLSKAVIAAAEQLAEAEGKLDIAYKAHARAVEVVEQIKGEIRANARAKMAADIAEPVAELNRVLARAAELARQIHNRMAQTGCQNLGQFVFPSPDPHDNTAAFTARNQRCQIFNQLAQMTTIGGIQ